MPIPIAALPLALCGPLALLPPAPPAAPPAAPAHPLAQGSGWHEDTDFGFKLKPPRDWTSVPLQIDERWQVLKYLADRPNFYTEKGGWTYEHKPEMLVIAFVDEVVRKKAEVDHKKDAEGERTVIVLKNPYKDYLDYLKRTHSSGGYYVSDERTEKLNEIEVTCYQIKVEKLTYTGPKRILAWVFHTPEVDFAVHFEVLENAYDKLERTLLATLRSFQLIPRTSGGLPTGDTLGGPRLLIEDQRKLTPEQRKARRVSLEKAAHARARETMPAGWSAFESKHFLVVNHTDEKYARRVAGQADALWEWLETAFAFVGPDEYVRSPVLRICASWDEMASYHKGGEDWYYVGSAPAEVVSWNDNSGFIGHAVEWINRQVVSLWFQERDRELSYAMPSWLVLGLQQVLGTSRVSRSGKLEFKPGDWERDGMRERIREGKAVPPRELLRLVQEDFFGGSGENFWGRNHESGAFVRYLLVGPGARAPRSKDLVRDYLKHLRAIITEIEAAEDAKKGEKEAKPKTEEEEEAYFKAKSQSWKKRERELIDQAFERTFRAWSDADWDELEKAYFKGVE